MRRALPVIVSLLFALSAPPGAALFAQEGLDAEARATLDTARRAIDSFFALDTFTIEHSQTLNQQIGISLGAESVTIDQRIEQQGTTITERQPGSRFDNATSTLDQVITQTIAGSGQEQALTLKQGVDMILLDGRAYLRMTSDDPALAGFFPDGWRDVTGGAEEFPGMEMYNLNQLLRLSNSAFSADVFAVLLDAVTEAETLAPETLDGVAVTRTRLALDPAAAFTGASAAALAEMFNAGALPLDVRGLLNLIFTDEKTRYEITLLLGADGTILYGYDVFLSMDIAIPASLLTDPTLAGAEMSLAQQSVSELRFTGQNEPVSITAPELGE